MNNNETMQNTRVFDIKDKKLRFVVDVIFWAIILVLSYITLKYFINQVMPLVLGFVFAAIARPLSRWMSAETYKKHHKDGTVTAEKRKIRLPDKLARVLAVLLVFVVMAGILALFVVRAVNFVVELVARLPGYYESTLLPAFNRAYDWVLRMVDESNEDVVELIKNALPSLISSMGQFVSSFSAKVLSWATSFASKVPGTVLSTIICIIAAFFFSLDFDAMESFFRRLMSNKVWETVVRVKDSFLDMIWQFIKSYALIFVITVAEIAVGLLIVGVKNPVMIACLIGIFDTFPIVGSGMILLPWAIITMMTGSLWKGIGLLIVYAVVVVAREFLEPKIVGARVGLRPLLTLTTMYIGNKLLGVIGLFGFPITAAILSDMERNGYIKLFWDERHAAESSDEAGTGENASGDAEENAPEAPSPSAEPGADSQDVEKSD